MRVWIIWPQTPPTPLLALIQSIGGTVVQVDDLLDRAEERVLTIQADVVLINSLTAGSQDFADWMTRRRFDRDDLRWVAAFPSLADHPQVAAWLPKLLRANVYDWVFESDQFVHDLRERLIHPWKWADALRVLGGPDAVAVQSDRVAARPDRTPEPPAPAPGRFSSLSRRLLWQRRADQARAEPSVSVRVLQPRRLLVLGAVGGAGVSVFTVTLAQLWMRLGIAVAVADGAATGGLLPLAWGSDPVAVGWDQALAPRAAWHQAAPGCLLLAQSGTRRGRMEPVETAQQFKTALAAIPGTGWPAILVDGGTDLAWSGALQGTVEAVVLVTTPDRHGLYAGARAVDVLAASGTPLAGFVLNRRHQPGQPLGRDVAEEWRVPCLADWPEAPDLWDPVWTGQLVPALAQRVEPLARQLAQSTIAPRVAVPE